MSIAFRTLAYIQIDNKPLIRSCEEPVGRWYAYTSGTGDASGGFCTLQVEISSTGTVMTGDCYYDVCGVKFLHDGGLAGAGSVTFIGISSERLHGAESWNLGFDAIGIYNRIPAGYTTHTLINEIFGRTKFKIASGYGVFSGLECIAPNSAVGMSFGCSGYIYDMEGKMIPLK